jgi:hypothetical protein
MLLAWAGSRRRPRTGAVFTPRKAWCRLVIPVAGQPSEAFMFDVNSRGRRGTLRDFPSCAGIESDLRFCLRKRAFSRSHFCLDSTTVIEETLSTKGMTVVSLTVLFFWHRHLSYGQVATKPRSKE